MSMEGMGIKGRSIEGMRVRTGHPRSLVLVCRSGWDRGTLGKKVYGAEAKTKLYMGIIGQKLRRAEGAER